MSKTLHEASKSACSAGQLHIILTLEDNQLIVEGSNSYVLSILGNDQLVELLKTVLSNSDAQDQVHATNKVPQFTPLPCSPFSRDWKKVNVRKILTDMLGIAGYKAAGRKKTLGEISFYPRKFHILTYTITLLTSTVKLQACIYFKS